MLFAGCKKGSDEPGIKDQVTASFFTQKGPGTNLSDLPYYAGVVFRTTPTSYNPVWPDSVLINGQLVDSATSTSLYLGHGPATSFSVFNWLIKGNASVPDLSYTETVSFPEFGINCPDTISSDTDFVLSMSAGTYSNADSLWVYMTQDDIHTWATPLVAITEPARISSALMKSSFTLPGIVTMTVVLTNTSYYPSYNNRFSFTHETVKTKQIYIR